MVSGVSGVFVFFKQKTAYEMRISDWSSDVCSSDLGCAYLTELFIAWYSGVEYEQYLFLNRVSGPYWWAYWIMMTCNVISPQLMWFKKLRTSLAFTFFISIVVNIGMRSEEPTSELQSLIRISYAVFPLQKHTHP